MWCQLWSVSNQNFATNYYVQYMCTLGRKITLPSWSLMQVGKVYCTQHKFFFLFPERVSHLVRKNERNYQEWPHTRTHAQSIHTCLSPSTTSECPFSFFFFFSFSLLPSTSSVFPHCVCVCVFAWKMDPSSPLLFSCDDNDSPDSFFFPFLEQPIKEIW